MSSTSDPTIDPNTRIVFLDMDGVMNHAGYYRIAKSNTEHDPIDPENVENLNNIIRNTGAKVVISSSWRMFYDYQTIEKLLKDKGFQGEVIGETPDISKYSAPRGCEIQEWIYKHVECGNKLTYNRYIILDDDSDMLLRQARHFIQTDFSGGGLTENLAYKAIRCLNSFENIKDW